MYIFELINKVLKENQKKRLENSTNTDEAEGEKCEHFFVPTDSTGETLACSKCGLVVKKMKKQNFNLFNQGKADEE